MSVALESEAQTVKRSVRLLRVSTKAQTDTDYDPDAEDNQGNSIDTQRKVTAEKERRLGSVNVGEYVEPGYSGQSIEKRPFFKQLMHRIVEQRDVDYVVIYARSRVFRNYIEAAIVKQQLERLGVRIISAREDFGDGYMAEAMEAVTDVFNWLQVKMSGQDIRTKMANKARNGGTIGRAKVGYLNQKVVLDGHKVNTVVLDPERAHYIPMAFQLFATGEETVASLQAKLTHAGFRMPPMAGKPNAPISVERLRLLLRDRYYVGYVTYQGIEYTGRHEPLISEELFEQVQRVLDSHGGSGTRECTYNHYLRGMVWCARCQHRLLVQRTATRDGLGEYFYFFCAGRRQGLCDLPYLPIEDVEDAVMRHYETELTVSATWLADLRRGVDDAVNADHGLTDELRAQYTKRLETLDRKESYLLDLAAEEGWPRDKLRSKIDAIRAECADIQGTVDQATQRLDVGRHVAYNALALLSDPAVAYACGNETVRALLNKTFFSKLYVDGAKITSQELREPFDVLLQHGEGQADDETAGGESRETSESAASRRGYGALDDGFKISYSSRIFLANDSTKPTWVGDTGIEPVTPAV